MSYPNDQGNPAGAIPVYGTTPVIFNALTTLDASMNWMERVT